MFLYWDFHASCEDSNVTRLFLLRILTQILAPKFCLKSFNLDRIASSRQQTRYVTNLCGKNKTQNIITTTTKENFLKSNTEPGYYEGLARVFPNGSPCTMFYFFIFLLFLIVVRTIRSVVPMPSMHIARVSTLTRLASWCFVNLTFVLRF